MANPELASFRSAADLLGLIVAQQPNLAASPSGHALVFRKLVLGWIFPMVYLKAIVILLVVWRVLTIGAFGQVVSGILAATLAFLLTRQSKSIPQQIKDIAAPLNDLKKNAPVKLAVSLIIDILSTQYIPVPWFFALVVGQAGFVPIGTFLVQFLYDRPALTGVDILKVQLPFANYVPTATLGWLIENGAIKEEWLGGSSGPLQRI